MPSSTSSSRLRRSAQDLAHLGFGLFVAVALGAFAGLLGPAAARDADIITHRDPPDADAFYLAHDRGGHVDHHVLYHGIDGDALSALRGAEVLFLGNSRLMFALDRKTLRRFFGERHLTYYALGFGHEEQDEFPLEIIQDNDLRPSVVVINADGFFAATRSAWAAQVVEETAFDAWKLQVEAEAAHRLRRVVHRVVPHYVDIRRGQREFVIYRSRMDGTWFVATRFENAAPFAWPPDDSHVPGDDSIRAAETFKQVLDRIGARMVLTVIPAPEVSLHRARVLADRLGVPLIVPRAGSLQTIDGSHLAHDSGLAVARSLLGQLDRLLRSIPR